MLNLDDPFGMHLATSSKARLKIGYSLANATASVDMLLAARDIRPAERGLRFTLSALQGECDVQSRVVGRYNVANLLAVAGVLLASGLPFEALASACRRWRRHRGACSAAAGIGKSHSSSSTTPIRPTRSPTHWPHCAMRPLRAAGVCCVFGCGGDRDHGKRPLMGEVATRLADAVLLTSDNPRRESPRAIIDEILPGAPGARIIVDRREALHARSPRRSHPT